MPSRSLLRGALLLLAWLAIGPGACGLSHAQLGTLIPDAEMPALGGGKAHLLSDAPVNVFIYFRPGQSYSRAALKKLAAVQKELADRPVHWVAVFSDRGAQADAEADVKAAGLTMPVLIDVGDHLFGVLQIVQLPMTALCDEQHKLIAYEPFREVNYATVVRARVRNLLHEITDGQMEAELHPPAALTDSEEAAASRRLMLATRLFEAKSYEKALENVDAGIARSPSAAAYALRGDILGAQGKCAEAIAAYEQALKLDAQNASAGQGMKGCRK